MGRGERSRVMDECRSYPASTQISAAFGALPARRPHIGADSCLRAHVRLKMTRPLGMVFTWYFGEWA